MICPQAIVEECSPQHPRATPEHRALQVRDQRKAGRDLLAAAVARGMETDQVGKPPRTFLPGYT